MKIGGRRAGIACGAAFASVLVAAATATPAWGSSSALVIGGIAAGSLNDVVMSELLGGDLRDENRVNVKWPAEAAPYTGRDDLTLGASINVGKTNLNTAIDAALARLGKDAAGNYIAGEKVTVVGLSAGSLVVNEVLRQLAADAEAPDKNQITFVLVADSSRQKLIDKARYNAKYDYTYQPAPETEYDIVVVTGEYDGMADFPDRWWNGLAVMNAIAGGVFVHVPVMFADLSKVPAENITVDVNSKGGTTTNYLVPTAKLPLVQMFPSLAKREAELKAKIDKAYSRNDVRATALNTFTAAPAVVVEAPAADEDNQAAVVTPTVVSDDPAVEVGDDQADEAVEETAAADSDSDAADVAEVADEGVAIEDENDDAHESADADGADSASAVTESSSDGSDSGSSESQDSE